MGFSQWLAETTKRFSNNPAQKAVQKSIMEAYCGIVRRIEGAGFSLGRDIYTDDWDVCIILDACRYDLYEEVRGPANSEWSIASKTGTFISRTFDKNKSAETAYVSANPHAKDIITFPWQSFTGLWDKGWDEDLKTVPPRIVSRYGLATREQYPDAKIILHYMQPHHPFTPAGYQLFGTWADSIDVWNHLEEGNIAFEEVWNAYRENLEFVMDEVDLLIKALDNERVLITSDHGNAAGEYGMYGHPGGLFLPSTRQVPWELINTGPAEEVCIDTNVDRLEHERSSEEIVQDRLESLGYA